MAEPNYGWFLGPDGKDVLEDIKEFCGVYDPTLYKENPMEGYRNIGKDEVIRYILSRVEQWENQND